MPVTALLKRVSALPAAVALATLVGAGLGLPAALQAQDIEYIESNRDWHAFRYTENGNPVCYMVSRPTRDEGDYTLRGDIYAMVTHRPAENETNAVSVIAGYPYREGSTVSVTIDNDDSYTLYTGNVGDEGYAWSYPEDQAAMIASMRAGVDMVVVGTSSRGTRTTDTYSLLGFTATKAAIDAACGV
jgi:hypothetical protein